MTLSVQPTMSSNEPGENDTFNKEENPVIDIIQHAEPFNEFLQNDILLYKAFPHLFPLGKGMTISFRKRIADTWIFSSQRR